MNKGDLSPRRYDGYQGNNKWQPRQNEGGWQRNNNYDVGQSSYPQKQPYKPPHIKQGQDSPINEFRDEVRGMFKELTEKMVQQAGDVNELKKQVSQIAKDVYERREDKGKQPSQTIPNPRQNVSVTVIKAEGKEKEQNLDSTSVENADVSAIKARTPAEFQQNEETSAENNQETCPEFQVSDFQILNSNPLVPSPCPMQIIERHEAINNGIQRKEYEDTRTNAKIQELEQGLQGALTNRTRDPGAFTVTGGIGNTLIPHCLIDLGASINVMPYDLYCSLKLGPMGDTQTKESPTLILGRPILFATKAKIDVTEGTVILEYGGKMAEFRVFEDDHQPCAGKHLR
ncbi:unnamed protein product [Rhodiola kirilowii]